jgi:hypothetical protein
MPRLTRLPRLLLVLLSLGAATSCLAQAAKGGTTYADSRVDVYGGYGYFHPINSGVNGYQYQPVYNPNATVSVSVFFNRYFGVQAEGGYFSGTNEHAQYIPCSGESCSQLIYTAEGGPIARFPLGRFVPFVHILGGGERTNGPAAQSLMWGWGVTGGGGIDYLLPAFNHLFAIRPIQADFQYSQVVYGPLVLPAGTQGGFGEIDNLKLSAGIVARFGSIEPPYPVMLGCGAQPPSVYPGDPVKVAANALHLNPKKTARYSWQSNGGKVMASGPEATIDTTSMAPGEYTITGHVQEGPKAREQASCAAPFTVKAFEPPTLTCSANPSTAVSGTDIAISTVGMSPQNRPLTYSYTSTAGVITSAGPAAILSTAGLSPSTITVTCNVVDDLGKTAQATTDIILNAPPVPVVAHTQDLCSLSFERDARRPVRVDNEAKGCLDDIALTLNQQADAHLVMVGNAAPKEPSTAAAERTLNARQYLVQEKGIDPARIEVRIGEPTGKTVTNTLVPTGALFNNLNTQTFDEKSIIRHGQAYGIPKLRKAPAAGVPQHKPAPPPAATTAPTAAPVAAPPAPATVSPSMPPATITAPTAAPDTAAPTSAPRTAVPVNPAALAPPPNGPVAPAPADTAAPTTPQPVPTTAPRTPSSSSPNPSR